MTQNIDNILTCFTVFRRWRDIRHTEQSRSVPVTYKLQNKTNNK